MLSLEKIREQFHYFNITSREDSFYGNWAVSRDGDVVNCVYPYVILSIHLREKDWTSYLKSKIWFRPECEKDLKHALERALFLIDR